MPRYTRLCPSSPSVALFSRCHARISLNSKLDEQREPAKRIPFDPVSPLFSRRRKNSSIKLDESRRVIIRFAGTISETGFGKARKRGWKFGGGGSVSRLRRLCSHASCLACKSEEGCAQTRGARAPIAQVLVLSAVLPRISTSKFLY